MGEMGNSFNFKMTLYHKKTKEEEVDRFMPQMSVWMIVASIIAVLVFLLIGFVLGVMYRKKVSEREIASAEDEAKRIINEGH